MGSIFFPKVDNLTATTNPTNVDDISKGYEVGSKWYNVTARRYYICASITLNNALWLLFDNLPVNKEGNTFTHVEHFIGSVNGSILPVTNSSNGGGAVSSLQAEPLHPGVKRLRTGTATTISRCQDTITSGTSMVWLNDGITQINIKAKPNVAALTTLDTFEVLIGFVNAVGIEPTFGIYFYYNFALHGDHFFRCKVVKGGVTVSKITTISLGAIAIWRDFEIKSNAGTPLVGNRNFEFRYSDDSGTPSTLVATITESEMTTAGMSLPYAIPDILTVGYGIQKPATSALQRNLDIDSITFHKTITS